MEIYSKYDFSEFANIMFNFKEDQSANRLRSIKNELNKFFKDSTCKEVIFTKNNDKLFFGMCVMPYIDGDSAVGILTGDNKKRITEYFVEIDSKLLTVGLSSLELVAVLLHEVGHLVNDSTPVEEVRNALNSYLVKNREHLVITDSIHYRVLLSYAIKDSIRKMHSIFFKVDDEIIADEFVVLCGFGPSLETAYRKIISKSGKINRDVTNKLLVLQWTLRIYKEIKLRRIGALQTLNRGKSVTASSLEKREIDVVSRAINQIDDDALIQESTNVMVRKTSELYKKFKYSGMRSIEDDLYEYALRAKNVDEQDEALLIIRQVNTRIAMIDDYILTEKLSDSDKERWYDLMNKYRMVRDDLSKKNTYADKYYGLFVNTPIIKSRYEV